MIFGHGHVEILLTNPYKILFYIEVNRSMDFPFDQGSVRKERINKFTFLYILDVLPTRLCEDFTLIDTSSHGEVPLKFRVGSTETRPQVVPSKWGGILGQFVNTDPTERLPLISEYVIISVKISNPELSTRREDPFGLLLLPFCSGEYFRIKFLGFPNKFTEFVVSPTKKKTRKILIPEISHRVCNHCIGFTQSK